MADDPSVPDPFKTALAAAAALVHQQRYAEAEETYRRLYESYPPSAAVCDDLGVIFSLQRKFDQAMPWFDRAVAIDPSYVSAHSNRARALMQMKDYAAAALWMASATKLSPNDALLWSDLGICYHEINNDPEAAKCFARVIEIDPQRAAGHAYLAQILRNLGQEAEALMRFRKALELDPSHPEYHMGYGMSLLLHGDFAHGWGEFEHRWLTDRFKPTFLAHRGPMWNGAPLNGKSIYLRPEQGLGDTIQFIRYAALVTQRGGRVIAGCHKPLKRVITTVPGISLALAESETLPAHDCYVPIVSLPRIFRTDLTSIPWPGPYVRVEDRLVRKWRQRLGLARRFNVGVTWAGNPQHTQDRHRSMPLEKLAPLAAIDGVRLFSLQKGPGAEQMKRAPAGMTLVDLGPELEDMMDTAAVMKSLDLVISVDTGPLHLAGAMGRPVWALIARAGDWRWMMGREDSPWYPSMRLFRQSAVDQWDDVIERVANELKAKTSGGA